MVSVLSCWDCCWRVHCLTTNRSIIRQHVPKIAFHVFNWTFISFIQSILLFMIAAPVYSILLATQFQPNVTTADLGYVAVELGLILTEWFADQQQWGKFTVLGGISRWKVEADTFQISTGPRASTNNLPRSLGASSRPIWSAVSSPLDSGHFRATPTLRPSSPSGSLCTSGPASLPIASTAGWPLARYFSSCCSRARRG